MTSADLRQFCSSALMPSFLNSLARVKCVFTFPRSRLRFKLIAILMVTVLFGMGLSSWLVFSLQRRQLIELAESHALHVSAVIEASLQHSMADNNLTMLKNMIAMETSKAGLVYIRIVDNDGKLWLSSDSSAPNQAVESNELPCPDCYPTGTAITAGSVAPDSQILGENLVAAYPIANQPECYACHSSAPKILGRVLVAAPIADLRTQWASSFQWVVFAGLFTFVLLVGLLTPALERFVTRPVVQLAKGATEIGAGNLDYKFHTQTNDELGELALTFDTMRQRLKRTLDEKERQNRELRTFNEIARITSELLDPQQILDLTVQVVVTSLSVQAGAIRIMDQERGQLTLHACHGIPQCTPKACNLRAVNIALVGVPNSQGANAVTPRSDEEGAFKIETDAQGHSYVGIPIYAKDVLVGGLTLITHPGQAVTAEGARVLKALGQQIGLAVLNAIHFQQARYDATLEERDRLAREMHDSLAQALGYLKMKASMADDLLSGGQIDKAQVNLREVKEIAGETYFDVREAIFGLRNSSSKGLQFLPGLEDYLNKYRLHYGLNVQVEAKNNCRPSFSPEVCLQLTRIIQEALTNVRKHAASNQATIQLERRDQHWCIRVVDEGNGFDSTATHTEGWRFLGLHIMRERAESFGAELEIDSHPGAGTRVLIRVPCESEG